MHQKQIQAASRAAASAQGDRFGLAILLLAAPNLGLIPAIPPFPLISSIPLLLLSWQMIKGRQEPYLPAWAAKAERFTNPDKLPTWIRERLTSVGHREKDQRINPSSLPLYGYAVGLAAITLATLPPVNTLGAIALIILGLGLTRQSRRIAFCGAIASLLSFLGVLGFGLFLLSASFEGLFCGLLENCVTID